MLVSLINTRHKAHLRLMGMSFLQESGQSVNPSNCCWDSWVWTKVPTSQSREPRWLKIIKRWIWGFIFYQKWHYNCNVLPCPWPDTHTNCTQEAYSSSLCVTYDSLHAFTHRYSVFTHPHTHTHTHTHTHRQVLHERTDEVTKFMQTIQPCRRDVNWPF